MENIKEMIDVNTIVGDAVETSEGTVIIPVSRVSFGFVAGGGEYKEDSLLKKKNQMTGAAMQRDLVKKPCPLQAAQVQGGYRSTLSRSW